MNVRLIFLSLLMALKVKCDVHHKPPNCETNTMSVISLTNLVCSNLALEDATLGLESCVGCFSLAARSNNNQPSIESLLECASVYLTASRYEICRDILLTLSETNARCVGGYCPFVQCLRRVNSDLLIAQCYEAAAQNNDALLEEEQIILFKNITQCILATTRCSRINPITGQRQSNIVSTTTYNKWGKLVIKNYTLYNSLQINRAGDLRIIAFNSNTKPQSYFCAIDFNLQDATWLDYTC